MADNRKKGIDRQAVIDAYNSGMGVPDVARVFGCSTETVRYHLRDTPKRGRGGAISRTIPAREINRRDEAEKQFIAEKNAENACVMLEDCMISLVGAIGNYKISTGKKLVTCDIGSTTLEFKFDDLRGFIEELKGVGRSISTFDIGTAMW